jgi:N-acyl-D-aspartate/D-glutamate deacylase
VSSYDLVIRNAAVVDGTGGAPFAADVAVAGDRIAAVGSVGERGIRELDADGLVVSPGFIDGHTHMDAQVMWDPLGTCSCWHGVTTVVMGNCGFTLAPVRDDGRPLVVRNLERAEDIAAEAMAEGIDWGWQTFPEYLDAVDRLPKGINYAAQIGHSALRTWAMGERAFDGEATADEIAAMAGEVRAAIRAGAIGFSTSRSMNHETSDDRPVASRLASWAEVEALVGAMGELGAGVFELAPEQAVRGGDPEAQAEFLGRLRRLAVDSGVPTTFGVLATTVDGSDWKPQLQVLDDTAADGGRMFGQTHSRGVTVLLSFLTRLPFDPLPVWRELRSRPLAEQARMLRDPALREKLVASAVQGGYRRAIGAEARPPDYDLMQVLRSAVPPHDSVAKVAAERGVHPVEAIIDLALESGLQQWFLQPPGVDDADALRAIMKHPRTVMTFSDSGAHVSQIVDCSIQTHLLAYWVRQRGDFTLPEAVRLITSAAADAWGFTDRGRVAEGMVADLNVFDPATIAPELPTVATDLPGGAKRLKQRATGIRATIVAGRVVLEDGEHTGVLPGRLLRGPLAV